MDLTPSPTADFHAVSRKTCTSATGTKTCQWQVCVPRRSLAVPTWPLIHSLNLLSIEEKKIHQELENKHSKVWSTFFSLLIKDNTNGCFITDELRIKDKVAAYCQSCLKKNSQTRRVPLNYVYIILMIHQENPSVRRENGISVA